MNPAGTARAGRPLRFLATVIGCWAGLRIWVLWPAVSAAPVLAHAEAAPVTAPAMASPALRIAAPPSPALFPSEADGGPSVSSGARPPAPARGGSRRAAMAAGRPGPGPAGSSIPGVPRSPTEPGSAVRFGDPVPAVRLATGSTAAGTGSRLSGSGWLLLRGGPALAGGLAGAQLGGSQAGLRLAYAVDGGHRLAITGRVSSAIGGSGAGRREASLGLAWRPTRAPVTLVAEQRFGLDGGHGGPVVGVIAGLGPKPIAAGVRVEAYGQAGAIARDGVEGFGDGAARVTRPLAIGGLRLDVGAGSWGGIQRGARRLDIGPTLGGAVPLAGHFVRLAFDWRARVAGNARPGSGPALSLGVDF